jgi:hypothetical protein
MHILLLDKYVETQIMHDMGYVEKRIEAKYYKPSVPFTPKEEARFRLYLKRTGKKAGAFARTAILAAMAGDKQGGDEA